MSRRIYGQAELPLPPVQRPEPDYPALARTELTDVLAKAKAATEVAPWPHRDQRMWRVVFPQMAGWLPAAEAEPMIAEFRIEIDRIDRLFFAGESK